MKTIILITLALALQACEQQDLAASKTEEKSLVGTTVCLPKTYRGMEIKCVEAYGGIDTVMCSIGTDELHKEYALEQCPVDGCGYGWRAILHDTKQEWIDTLTYTEKTNTREEGLSFFSFALRGAALERKDVCD